MFGVTRFIEGVCLNGKEWLLDEKNEVLTFETESQAREFLGIAEDEDAEEKYGIYFEEVGEEK